MPGIAYFDKHVQPSKDDCVGTLLTNVNLHVNLELILWKLGRRKLLESRRKYSQNRRHPTGCVQPGKTGNHHILQQKLR